MDPQTTMTRPAGGRLRTGRKIQAGLVGLVLLAGAVVWNASTAQAACSAPELELSTETVRPFHVISVTGLGFIDCQTTIIDGRLDVSRPAENIELSVQQGSLDFAVALVGGHPSPVGDFVQPVRIPSDFVPGEASVTATVPPQAGYPEPYTVSVPLTVTTQQPTIRVAGESRIETAAAISRRAFPDRAATVYLARADVGVDAMVGGALIDGPILLVPQCGELPDVVAEEIARLTPGVIATLGGSGAVCDALLETAAAVP